MFCKYCGMESESTDKCSWCHRSLVTTQTSPASPPDSGAAPHHPSPQSLAEEEEAQYIEESPLASGQVPGPPAAPSSPPLPWASSAEQAASPTVPPTSEAPRAPGRPIIGVRGRPSPSAPQQPASSQPPPASPTTRHAPPPATPTQRPTIGVRGAAPVSPAAPGTGTGQSNRPPAPGTPPPSARIPAPSMPPASARTSTPAGPPVVRPAAPSANTGATPPSAAPPNPVQPSQPSSRPSLPSSLTGGGAPPASQQPAPSVNRPGVPPAAQPYNPPAPQPYQPTAPYPAAQPYQPAAPQYNAATPPYHPVSPATQPDYEEEAGGLAAGVAARSRPANQATMEMNVPTMGTFTAQPSKYYSGQVIDPMSGTHYDASSGRVVSGPGIAPPTRPNDIVLNWDDAPPLSRQLPRYLAAFAGILLVAALLAGFMPAAYVAPLCLATFAGAMLLPVFKVVPWQDEDGSDALWLAVLLLVFGPAIGLIIYCVVCAVRQDFVPAVVGCMLVALITRVTLLGAISLLNPAAFHDMHLSMMQALNPPWIIGMQGENANETTYDWGLLFINWSPLLALAGWYVANVFHKEDE